MKNGVWFGHFWSNVFFHFFYKYKQCLCFSQIFGRSFKAYWQPLTGYRPPVWNYLVIRIHLHEVWIVCGGASMLQFPLCPLFDNILRTWHLPLQIILAVYISSQHLIHLMITWKCFHAVYSYIHLFIQGGFLDVSIWQRLPLAVLHCLITIYSSSFNTGGLGWGE